MSVTVKESDIFSLKVDAIVNPVDCTGAMGAGLALSMKRRFPKMASHFADMVLSGQVGPGLCTFYQCDETDIFIISLPTKRHWREPSRLDDIEAGLSHLHKTCTQYGLQSLAIPALGCGLGRLDWADVLALIKAEFGESTIDVTAIPPIMKHKVVTHVIVCGGRDFSAPSFVNRALNAINRRMNITTLIEGEAMGADILSRQWAESAGGITIERFKPDWKTHGRRAGMIRNGEMLSRLKEVCGGDQSKGAVIAFPGGVGTDGMCKISKSAGFRVFSLRFEWSVS